MANQENDSFYEQKEIIRTNCKFKILSEVEYITKNYSGIYMIYNFDSNRIYIGSAMNFYHRKHVHLSYLRNKKHHSKFLQNDFNNGNANVKFYILEYCLPELLIKTEQKYLDIVFKEKYCYNMNPVADSWFRRKHTEETKKILSDKAKQRKLSQETKNKIRNSMKGKRIGEKNPMFGKTGNLSPVFGIKCSEETRKKQSLLKKGKLPHENSLNSLIKGGKECAITRRIKVKATNLLTNEIVTFDSLTKAAKIIGTSTGKIAAICDGKPGRKSSKNWTFSRLEE